MKDIKKKVKQPRSVEYSENQSACERTMNRYARARVRSERMDSTVIVCREAGRPKYKPRQPMAIVDWLTDIERTLIECIPSVKWRNRFIRHYMFDEAILDKDKKFFRAFQQRLGKKFKERQLGE